MVSLKKAITTTVLCIFSLFLLMQIAAQQDATIDQVQL
jgi:hypothetical protein